jgi:hypothetical protein
MKAFDRWILAAALIALGLAASCHQSRRASSGNTNWLRACTADSDCDLGFSCACSVCTRPCDQTPECAASGEAVRCTDPSAGEAGDLCAAELIADRAGICLRACGGDDDCEPGQTCQAGGCIGASAAVMPAGIRAFEDPSDWPAPTTVSCEAGGLLIDSGVYDQAWAIAVAGDSLLIAGSTDTPEPTDLRGNVAWRVERRSLADLAPVAGFGTGGAVEVRRGALSSVARVLALDPDFVYTAGVRWDDEIGDIQVEKRNLATGQLAADFGTAGVLSLEQAVTTPHNTPVPALGLVVDGPYLYMTSASFTVEKRNAADGSLVAEFGAAGVSQNEADDGSLAQALVLRDGVLYVAGSEGFAGTRLEARDAATGELLYEVTDRVKDNGCGRQGTVALAATDDALYLAGRSYGQWHVERRRRSDGERIYAQELPPSGNCESALGLALDDAAMYVAGENDHNWRVEKRSLVDGELVEGFGEGGVIESSDHLPTGAAHAIAVQDGVLHVAGAWDQRFETQTDWRLERRSAADGSILECPSWTPDVPGVPYCGSTPRVGDGGPLAGVDCEVRVASSVPCAGLNVRASAGATREMDWTLHYQYAGDREDWGLLLFGGPVDTASSYAVLRGFGFDLPERARVLGIAVEIARHADEENSITDEAMRLVKGNHILDAEHAREGAWSAGMTTAAYGGPDDRWGTTWTAAEINDPTFGIALRAQMSGPFGGTVDEARARVYYCE